MLKEMVDDDAMEPRDRLPQELQDDWLAENIDFSDEEDLTQSKGYISNAPMYQMRDKPAKGRKFEMPQRKGGREVRQGDDTLPKPPPPSRPPPPGPNQLAAEAEAEEVVAAAEPSLEEVAAAELEASALTQTSPYS